MKTTPVFLQGKLQGHLKIEPKFSLGSHFECALVLEQMFNWVPRVTHCLGIENFQKWCFLVTHSGWWKTSGFPRHLWPNDMAFRWDSRMSILQNVIEWVDNSSHKRWVLISLSLFSHYSLAGIRYCSYLFWGNFWFMIIRHCDQTRRGYLSSYLLW